jgi:hypothetical protein
MLGSKDGFVAPETAVWTRPGLVFGDFHYDPARLSEADADSIIKGMIEVFSRITVVDLTNSMGQSGLWQRLNDEQHAKRQNAIKESNQRKLRSLSDTYRAEARSLIHRIIESGDFVNSGAREPVTIDELIAKRFGVIDSRSECTNVSTALPAQTSWGSRWGSY